MAMKEQRAKNTWGSYEDKKEVSKDRTARIRRFNIKLQIFRQYVLAQGQEQTRKSKPIHTYMETHYKVALALQMWREMNFIWNVDLNVKGKTYKLLEKNMGE